MTMTSDRSEVKLRWFRCFGDVHAKNTAPASHQNIQKGNLFDPFFYTQLPLHVHRSSRSTHNLFIYLHARTYISYH